jgi:hypothetical protein
MALNTITPIDITSVSTNLLSDFGLFWREWYFIYILLLLPLRIEYTSPWVGGNNDTPYIYIHDRYYISILVLRYSVYLQLLTLISVTIRRMIKMRMFLTTGWPWYTLMKQKNRWMYYTEPWRLFLERYILLIQVLLVSFRSFVAALGLTWSLQVQNKGRLYFTSGHKIYKVNVNGPCDLTGKSYLECKRKTWFPSLSHFRDFLDRVLLLTRKLLNQGL